MKAVTFEIPGAPQGKGRPRFSRAGGFVKAYTPEKTKDYENLVAWSYKAQAQGFRFPDGTPLYVAIYAYYPIPKRTSKKDRVAMLSGDVRPTVKPDNDNVLKIVCDALNGIAYDDDKCVVDSYLRKYYADEPKTVVVIREAVAV